MLPCCTRFILHIPARIIWKPLLKWSFLQTNKILQQVMNNIVCQSVFDIFILLDVLHQLKSILKSQVFIKTKHYSCYLFLVQFSCWILCPCTLKMYIQMQTGCQVRLLIVDSISSLITPILGSGAHGMYFCMHIISF